MSNAAFKKPVTVIEIGNDWLKIAENSPSAPGRVISKVNLTKLAQINEPVASALSRIFKENNLNKQGVVTYLPRNLVTVRVLEFPSTDPKEINDMVSLQVTKQTPYSKDEIYSSHKVVSSDREGYTKVMLVIARRSLVSERVDTLLNAGLTVEKVGVSTEGVFNWLCVAYPNELVSDVQRSVVVLDVDSNYSDFMVVRKEGPVFTRSILVGANQLMEELEKWQDKFVEEVRHSIDLYQGEQRGAKVVKVMLSGAGKNVRDLSGTLGAKLGVMVENAVPVKNMRIKDSTNVLQDPNLNFVSVSALFGIAVRHKELDLDMTPHDLRIQRKTEEKRKQLVV
ncbi:MAG: pilus assembly protein PilM, partial [Candidatus Omnitrophica bacterium]|nr:pilus assembly protein PilM [Candidatus Omnitrophota bacterium]